MPLRAESVFALRKKNVPWHILAPRRGCFGNHLPLRRVRIPAELFLSYGNEVSYTIRKNTAQENSCAVLLPASKTISRVMSCIVIYPIVNCRQSALSDPPESMIGQAIYVFYSVLLRMGFTYALVCYRRGGSLLHCLSTLTRQSLAVSFLLHYPWSHLHRTLSGILPCEARTFLTCPLSGALRLTAATTYLTLPCAAF